MNGDVRFVRPLTDAELEALQSMTPAAVAGDNDWSGGAHYLYVFDRLAEYRPAGFPDGRYDLTLPAGQYLRSIYGKQVAGWVVTGDAAANVDLIEQKWQAYDNAPPHPCDECGAAAREPCRSANCQGTWR